MQKTNQKRVKLLPVTLFKIFLEIFDKNYKHFRSEDLVKNKRLNNEFSKKLSLCNKLCFIIPLSCSSQIFQNMTNVRSNNRSLKYQRFAPSGYEDIGIRKFKFVANIQFLCECDYHNKRKLFIVCHVSLNCSENIFIFYDILIVVISRKTFV